MGVSLQSIIQYLEKLAPPQRAQSWDKIGLQVGDRQAQVNSLMVALDASEVVINQAIDMGTELIITHHPLIFSPLNTLVWQDDPLACLLAKLIRANINLYVAHTNLDASSSGASNLLADLLGLKQTKPLVPMAQKLNKEAVYDGCPLESADSEYGVGLVGCLKKPQKISKLATQLYSDLNLNGLRWVGDGNKLVEKVAVCGGSGGDLVTIAKQAGAQLLISGDFKYHQACQAQMLGISVLDIGHFACEYLAMQKLAQNLKDWFEQKKQPVEVLTCPNEASPFYYYLAGNARG